MSNQPPYWSGQPRQPANDPRYPPQYVPEQVRPYGSYPPSQPVPGVKRSWLSRQTSQTKVLLLVGATVFAVGLVVAISVIGSGSSGSGAGAIDGSHISGSRDQWLQAVCRDGSYSEPRANEMFPEGLFPNATGSGACMAAHSNFPGAVPIWLGQWDSDYMMRNDLTGRRMGSYAAASDRNLITAFAVRPRVRDALEPLTQFGFTIHELAPPNR